jgi:hypothetical protein
MHRSRRVHAAMNLDRAPRRMMAIQSDHAVADVVSDRN